MAAMAAAAPFVSMGLGVASLGMNILGASQQSQAQRDTGQIVYANALLRKQQADQQAAQEETQAKQLEADASTVTGAGQIQQIEAIRKGQVMAGRARAVMAASGAGVDEGILQSLQGEANYAGDVAAYNAADKARGLTNQATMDRWTAANTRWSGNEGAAIGAADEASYNRAADATIIGGVGRSALSFADKYGGGLFGSGTNTTNTGVGDSLTQAGSLSTAQQSIDAFGGPVIYNALA